MCATYLLTCRMRFRLLHYLRSEHCVEEPGVDLTGNAIHHREMVKGGVLEFQMSAEPLVRKNNALTGRVNLDGGD